MWLDWESGGGAVAGCRVAFDDARVIYIRDYASQTSCI